MSRPTNCGPGRDHAAQDARLRRVQRDEIRSLPLERVADLPQRAQVAHRGDGDGEVRQNADRHSGGSQRLDERALASYEDTRGMALPLE